MTPEEICGLWERKNKGIAKEPTTGQTVQRLKETRIGHALSTCMRTYLRRCDVMPYDVEMATNWEEP